MENERIAYYACPLCQSAEIYPLATVDCTGHAMWHEPLEPAINWVQCGECRHIFTDGYFTAEAFEVLYSVIPDEASVGTNAEFNRRISATMVERVVAKIGLPNNRLWLDIGFGNGALLMTAKEPGFECAGIEFIKRNVEDIQQFGISAYHGQLADAVSNNAFNTKPTVISMADVVEHEAFPLESLRCAQELINYPGMLLISMPNASAPLWHHMNATNQNPYWAEINHFHNFTRENLYATLKKTGFRPIHYNISERYRCCMEVLAETE
jgi:2-polyprenyl-3-methyl-5-hydroxy-6-metoxy-1,4-benzoquinol methylase